MDHPQLLKTSLLRENGDFYVSQRWNTSYKVVMWHTTLIKKTFDEARLEPLVVLHASGSVAIPKLVIMAHGTLSCIDAYRLVPSTDGRKVFGPSWQEKRLLMGFSLFHAASMCYLLGLGIYCMVLCVLPPANVQLIANIVDQIHPYGSVACSGLPPSLLVDLVNDPYYLRTLRHLESIFYAGGPLAKDAGDAVSSVTRLLTVTGSTEMYVSSDFIFPHAVLRFNFSRHGLGARSPF